MLFHFKRDILLKPLTQIMGFVETKQIMPILANVYFKKWSNNLTIIANDMEIQASININSMEDNNDFTLTLSAKKLQEILKTFTNDENITMELINSKVTLSSNNTKFIIHSMPAEHYPLLRLNDNCLVEFDLTQKVLKNLISMVAYAMAINDSRSFLNGMLFELKNNQLILVTTDAHRLAYITHDLKLKSLAAISYIIPRKTILELQRLLEDNEDKITIKFYPTQICFRTETKELISKIIDGKYPDYLKVIPNSNDKLCLVNRQELLRSVQKVAVIGNDKLRIITIEIKLHVMIVTCRNEEQEESRDEIKIKYLNNNQLKLNFNISYIKDALSNCNYENLELAFYDNQRSVLITIPEQTQFKSVIMPLRI